MNSSGFYKVENEMLLYGCQDVFAPDFTLLRNEHNEYEYPIDGWYWFDTEEEAMTFFNIQINDKIKEMTETPYNNFIVSNLRSDS